MKYLFIALTLITSICSNAQSERYVNAMQKNLSQFDSVKTTQDYQALAANFERIGEAEKTEWLPYYYSALALLTPAWFDQNLDKDQNAVKVKQLCDKAEALAKDNESKSEVYTLRNIVATQQMIVDPQNRYMQYGQESAAHLQKGKELNPGNPRLFYLEGAGILNTPEQFGGGKSKAKPILQKAVELYNAEKPRPMYPNWGKQQAEEMLAQCG